MLGGGRAGHEAVLSGAATGGSRRGPPLLGCVKLGVHLGPAAWLRRQRWPWAEGLPQTLRGGVDGFVGLCKRCLWDCEGIVLSAECRVQGLRGCVLGMCVCGVKYALLGMCAAGCTVGCGVLLWCCVLLLQGARLWVWLSGACHMRAMRSFSASVVRYSTTCFSSFVLVTRQHASLNKVCVLPASGFWWAPEAVGFLVHPARGTYAWVLHRFRQSGVMWGSWCASRCSWRRFCVLACSANLWCVGSQSQVWAQGW